MQNRLVLNPQKPTCLCLPSTGIKGMHHQTHPDFLFMNDLGVVKFPQKVPTELDQVSLAISPSERYHVNMGHPDILLLETAQTRDKWKRLTRAL